MTLYGLCHNASYAESRLSPAQAQRYGARLARTIVYGSDESRAAVIANARELQAAGVETLVVVTTETTGHVVDDLDAWTRWIAAFLDEAQGAVYAIEPGNELDTPGWTMSDGAPISNELIIAIGRRAAEVCRYHGVLCTSPSLLTGPEEGRFEAVARGLAGHVQAMACLVPDQRISARGVAHAMMRRYEGDVITIETSTGKKVTCTPNHPILTRHGWVAASEIHENTKIAEYTARDPRRGRANDVKMPTPISDVFRSLAKSERPISRPGTPLDFYGDGRNSDVYVVSSNGMLRRTLAQRLEHIQLKPSLMSHSARSRFSYAHSRRFGIGQLSEPWSDALRDSTQPSALIRASEAQPLSIGPASGGKSSATKQQAEVAGLLSKFGGNAFHGLAAQVTLIERGNLLIRHTPASASHMQSFQPVLSEQSIDSTFRDPKTDRDVLNRIAGQITFVEVTSVSSGPFSGHVYDLNTEDGLILADSIITHNCHPYYCAVGGVPDRPETRQAYPLPLRAHRWRYGAVEEKATVCERLGHGLPVWFTELGCPVGFDAITAQEQALWTYHLRRLQHPTVEVALQFCLTDAMVPQAELDEQKNWGITDAQGEKVSALMLAGYTTPPRPVTPLEGGSSMPSPYRVGPGVLEAMRQHNDQPGSDECYYPVGANASQWSETMALSGAIYRYLFATNQTYRFPPDQAAAALVRP